MALRRAFGCLLVAAAMCTVAACKDKGKTQAGGDLGPRCEQLGKTCGDNDKHAAKIVEGCKAAKPTCADKVSALFDCYEKELCGKGERIWAFDDQHVLADSKTKCAAEPKAVAECK